MLEDLKQKIVESLGFRQIDLFQARLQKFQKAFWS
jgi:hypothetical protein